jgi:hypothetical protein
MPRISSTSSTSLVGSRLEGTAGAFDGHRAAVIGQLQGPAEYGRVGSGAQGGLVDHLRDPVVGADRHVADHVAAREAFGWRDGYFEGVLVRAGPVADVVLGLKARPVRDIGVHGSIELAQSLLAADVVGPQIIRVREQISAMMTDRAVTAELKSNDGRLDELQTMSNHVADPSARVR